MKKQLMFSDAEAGLASKPFEAQHYGVCTHDDCTSTQIKPGQVIVNAGIIGAKDYQHAHHFRSETQGTDVDADIAVAPDHLNDIVRGTQGKTNDGMYRVTDAYNKPTKFQGTSLEEMGF